MLPASANQTDLHTWPPPRHNASLAVNTSVKGQRTQIENVLPYSINCLTLEKLLVVCAMALWFWPLKLNVKQFLLMWWTNDRQNSLKWKILSHIWISRTWNLIPNQTITRNQSWVWNHFGSVVTLWACVLLLQHVVMETPNVAWTNTGSSFHWLSVDRFSRRGSITMQSWSFHRCVAEIKMKAEFKDALGPTRENWVLM